ncbi:MAG: TraB/GumN family protein [Sulfurifustis sp.]
MRDRVRGWCGLFLLVFGFWLPVLAAEAPPAHDVGRRVEAAPKRGFLYEVKRGAKVAYVFGTIHVGRPDFYPLNLPVTRALTAAKYLAVEANVSDPAAVAKEVTQYAIYPDSMTLDRELPPAMMKKVSAVLDQYHLPRDQTMKMRPWMLALTLSLLQATQAGYDPQWAAESYLLGIAKSQKKPIVEVEGLRRQMDLFTGLSSEQQFAFLDRTLDELEDGEAKRELIAFVDAWTKADAAALEHEWNRLQKSHDGSDRFVIDKLLIERNGFMAGRIEEYLRSGDTYFVAIGAMHLIGEKSVIALLRQRGYQVRGL